MVSLRVWFPLGFLISSSLVGCGGMTPSVSPLSSPVFVPTSDDTRRLATVTHELDARILACVEASACEQVNFARALVSLFENREAARASFRRVIADNPSSALGTSSRLWLRVIGDEETTVTSIDEQRNLLTDIAAQFARDWIEWQVAEHTNHGKPGALMNAPDPIVEQSRVVQVLQKQVHERDRRIAVLRSQLDALKLIDQDHEERKRTLKMPATLLPMTDTRR